MRSKSIVVVVGVLLASNSVSFAVVMTFDTVTAPFGIPYDGVYVEAEMIVISKSHYSCIGDPIGETTGEPGLSTNGFYFHGTNEYIEFRMISGTRFDLLSLDFYTNGYTEERWLETSSGAFTFLPGYRVVTTIAFSGAGYSNIEWFRVGTPWYATEVDNITFIPEPAGMVPVPDVLGMTVEDANDVLASAGLVKGNVTYECGGTLVTEQYPNGGVLAPLGSTVDLVLKGASQVTPVTIFVNVDATVNGDPEAGFPTVDVSLPAGRWRLSPTNPGIDAEALYIAWSPWSSGIWNSRVSIKTSTIANRSIGAMSFSSTAAEAFANPANRPLDINLETADTLQFYVGDQILNDNLGGVSIRINSMVEISDFNCDGDVNLVDFAILAGQWLEVHDQPSADIAPEGGDGLVDFLDLAALTEHWLEDTTP